MSDNDIKNVRLTFDRLLLKHRLHDAIALLRNTSERNLRWEITDEVNKIDSSYRYLLQYAVDGVDDPGRNDIYNSLVESLSVTFNRLERYIMSDRSSTAYYTTVRRLRGKTIASAIADYRECLNRYDAFSQAISGSGKGEMLNAAKAIEDKEIALFDRVWTGYPISRDDTEELSRFLTDDLTPRHVKQLLVSALMLGNLEFLDSRRLVVLADVYTRYVDSDAIGVVALTAMVLSLFVGRKQKIDLSSEKRLEALNDIPQFESDLRLIFMEFIRTRDTERITQKLTGEIVPEMLKIKPEIDKKMAGKKVERLDLNDIEDNPEWQELLDKSGISEKMKELSEIQEEGGDVMMGTFAHLKSFPFFFNVANWFVPFHTAHSTVVALGEGTDVIAELLQQATFICDSDKYSFVLAMSGVAQSQRDMMTSQLKAQNVSAAEIQNAGLALASDSRKNHINKYVQNLYRFFRLFRRKGDFADPFASEINLTEVGLLKEHFIGDGTLELVAEFYFSHKYYKEALTVFNIIDSNDFPEASRYQKMGLCYQKLGDYAQALNYYEQAELLNADSKWTLRRLAACNRQAGNFEKALGYYRRLEAMEPENASIATQVGNCLLALDRYDEAVKSFFKANYLQDDSVETTRRLAWAQLMNRDFEHAATSYAKLIGGDNTVAEDFLNAGHLEMALGNYRKAIDDYAVSVRLSGNNFTVFLNSMRADTPSLLKLGVSAEMIPLVIDSVAYRVAE